MNARIPRTGVPVRTGLASEGKLILGEGTGERRWCGLLPDLELLDAVLQLLGQGVEVRRRFGHLRHPGGRLPHGPRHRLHAFRNLLTGDGRLVGDRRNLVDPLLDLLPRFPGLF